MISLVGAVPAGHPVVRLEDGLKRICPPLPSAEALNFVPDDFALAFESLFFCRFCLVATNFVPAPVIANCGIELFLFPA